MIKRELYKSELFERNNFDLLRLIAASQVAIVHGIEHLEVEFLYPAAKYLAFIPGVPIFFFLIGLFITALFSLFSWNFVERPFLRKRKLFLYSR